MLILSGPDRSIDKAVVEMNTIGMYGVTDVHPYVFPDLRLVFVSVLISLHKAVDPRVVRLEISLRRVLVAVRRVIDLTENMRSGESQVTLAGRGCLS